MKLTNSNSEHIGAAAAAVSKDEDVEVAAPGERQWAEVVDAEGDVGAVKQR